MAAGHLCVLILACLSRLPPRVTERLLRPALRIYPRLRAAHTARLRACFAAAGPFRQLSPGLDITRYYAMRLRLLSLGLAAHGRKGSKEDRYDKDERNGQDSLATGGPTTTIAGRDHYSAALASGRPIALIGLHAGPWEELHRIPGAGSRSFRILTAPAFSPPLTAFMARGRERRGKRILWLGGKGRRGLAAGIRQVISERGVLALMADQHPGPAGECRWITLWGSVQVPYPARLLHFLAGREFLFLPVSVRLEADGTKAFRFHEPWEIPRGGGAKGNGEEVGRALAGCVRAYLESAIAAAPDQWNWSYPKIRPMKKGRGTSLVPRSPAAAFPPIPSAKAASGNPPAAGPRPRRAS